MITLATLPQATEQEVFDQVATHLLTQMEKSRNTKFEGPTPAGCLYRYGSLKCAAGCLVGEDEYPEIVEGVDWNDLIEMDLVPINHASLIGGLQTIHDYSLPVEWAAELRDLAAKRGLSSDVLINLHKELTQ